MIIWEEIITTNVVFLGWLLVHCALCNIVGVSSILWQASKSTDEMIQQIKKKDDLSHQRVISAQAQSI